MAVRLSIVIPTLGRPSLARTLESCADADEIVVVLDTSRGTTELPCELPPNAVFHADSFGVTGGHAGRAVGIGMATGTHLAFMDDDDVYTPGAMDVMRAQACDRPVIFRMDHYTHGILWKDPQIRFANVSTQMYLVPNDPARFGSWTPHVPGLKEPGGDYTFIKETCELMGAPVWREEIISVLRPDRGPSITVVTPWHNHLELAPDYLAAMHGLTGPDRLLVVDNGSDPAVDFAAIRFDHNAGFSHASNAGLLAAETDAVLFLNNDVVMTSHDWLAQIRAALEPGVLVGPRMRYDRHGQVDNIALPYLDGWCLAGMTADLLELGGFDEAYQEPAYYSDNDLCLRARAAGMTLREVKTGIRHLTGVTAGPPGTPEKLAAVDVNYPLFEQRAREILAATAAA